MTGPGALQDGSRIRPGPALSGVLTVVAGGALAQFLTTHVPEWSAGTLLEDLGGAVEFPVYAIIIGLVLNAVLSALGIRGRLAAGFRTEFFIKTGLALLGGKVVLSVIMRAAGPAILQTLLLITGVFFFTWWFAGKLGIDDHLRALASSAGSICGVSAAIAAAGAVKAKKEHLAYTATMVIAFELPSISILPWLADLLGLSPAVAGAWIGGNIDTTAAVSAAGAPAGEDSLQIASIVKLTQNALIGVVAVALTDWFALRVERDESAPRIRAIDFWHRFPKFVLGFIAASVAVTVAAEFLSEADLDGVDSAVKGFRDYFLTLAFVSVGLEFEAKALREAGMKPVAVFAAATLFNIVLGLALATLLFSNFEV
ncbi:MAG: putative sulfate exporter family transporter [Corynebacterium variabile]|nr:putative sulfate exporter family transporter [Corynebacterium variabile]